MLVMAVVMLVKLVSTAALSVSTVVLSAEEAFIVESSMLVRKMRIFSLITARESRIEDRAASILAWVGSATAALTASLAGPKALRAAVSASLTSLASETVP